LLYYYFYHGILL